MAIYHCSIKSISRGQGHSVTAAAAYRAGIRIEDNTTGLIHDYTRKKGVVSVEMLAPADAPTWAADPSMLWNAAGVAETRKNARVGREMIVALPHEMSDTQRRELAIGIGQMLVDRYKVPTQIALHSPDKEGDQRNYHAHILFTSRQIAAEGLGAYASKILDDFKQGRKEITALRTTVAQIMNQHLEQGGLLGARGRPLSSGPKPRRHRARGLGEGSGNRSPAHRERRPRTGTAARAARHQQPYSQQQRRHST